jgi:hypothetical protein
MTEHSTVTTKHGPLDLYPVDADRVRIEVGIPMNVDGRSFDLNGVPHAVQAWAYLWSDGRWHLGREDDRVSQLHEPNLTRRDRYGGGELKDPSRSAYEKARTAIEEAVNEWASAAEARHVLSVAHVEQLEKELDRAVSRHEQAEQAVAATKNEVDEANDRLTRARFVHERQSGGR